MKRVTEIEKPIRGPAPERAADVPDHAYTVPVVREVPIGRPAGSWDGTW